VSTEHEHAEQSAPPAPARPAAPVTAPAAPQRELLALQSAVGNREVGNILSRQPDGGGGGTATPTAGPEPDFQASADDFEADAMDYYEQNMRMELQTAAGVEGIGLGRRAGVAAANAVRETCEPYDKDQEMDTQVLNTVFSLAGGGASIAEGFTSGPKPGQAGGGVNIASRATRAALGLIQVWMPQMAGYRTVGSLKEAAVRQATETGAQAGEGGSGSFQDYENEVMKELDDRWRNQVIDWKNQIIRDRVPVGIVAMMKSMLPTERGKYLQILRTEYGAASEVGTSVTAAATQMMAPRMAQLHEHLEQAKTHRQRMQAGASVVGGIAGGAAIGAGIGAFFGGVGAVPGAIIGGVVGGVVGTIGAAAILWD
jgi:hypothetical protein